MADSMAIVRNKTSMKRVRNSDIATIEEQLTSVCARVRIVRVCVSEWGREHSTLCGSE